MDAFSLYNHQFAILLQFCLLLIFNPTVDTKNDRTTQPCQTEVLEFENRDITSVVMPVDIDQFEKLLVETDYNRTKMKKLKNNFRNGFRLEYTGNRDIQMRSPNLKFHEIGDDLTLWNKVMKEVELKRYAGPFENIPFEHFIQSPIGLIPKDSGKNSRLIFHLSYPRGTNLSVNTNTDRDLCRVTYPDFSDAVRLCIAAGRFCKMAKSDMSSAFRHLGMSPLEFCLLVMKAKHPKSGKIYYFVDKCLPFGASISCAHFQNFSNAVAHIVQKKTGHDLINYLDDYLFVALLRLMCNSQVKTFLNVCEMIKFPVSLNKMFWGMTRLVFLGFLLDLEFQVVCLLKDKIDRALELISKILNKTSKKITLHQLQKICGFLNFMGRAIIPGRAFTRRLYSHTANPKLKPHHHIKITTEMRLDLLMWKEFLSHQSIFCRPFMDFSKYYSATEVDVYSDASKNPLLGMGGVCRTTWMSFQWETGFIENCDPSIEYLELFALTATVMNWISRFRNKRIILFCDNISVVYMVNNTSSKCKNCMVLIRLLVLTSLIENIRIYAKYVSTKDNKRADLLSRLKVKQFKEQFRHDTTPTPILEQLWPISKLWVKSKS